MFLQIRNFSKNNFDLIRLLAASQVMVTHTFEGANSVGPSWLGFIYYFPGVPAFFFISGFLISASWERHADISAFARNRFLRIYPALAGVFLFSLLSVLLLNRGFHPLDHVPGLLVWAVTQLTLLQAWNPPFLRGFGTGVPNGSLWTIPVELCFYIATPLMYWAGRRLKSVDGVLIAVAVLSYAIQFAAHAYYTDTHIGIVRALLLSPIPWIAAYCVGVLAQRHFGALHDLVAGRAWVFAGIYVAVSLLSYLVPAYPLLKGVSNSLGLLNFGAMALLILSLAYTLPDLADRILRRNDISYGVYIFHMPVFNSMLALDVVGISGFWATIAGTIAFASLSWFLIEKPALSKRKSAIYSHSKVDDPAPQSFSVG